MTHFQPTLSLKENSKPPQLIYFYLKPILVEVWRLIEKTHHIVIFNFNSCDYIKNKYHLYINKYFKIFCFYVYLNRNLDRIGDSLPTKGLSSLVYHFEPSRWRSDRWIWQFFKSEMIHKLFFYNVFWYILLWNQCLTYR